MKAQRLMFPQILNFTHPTPPLKISTCASWVSIFLSDFSAPWAAGSRCRIASRRDCRYHYCFQNKHPASREIVMGDLELLRSLSNGKTVARKLMMQSNHLRMIWKCSTQKLLPNVKCEIVLAAVSG